MQDLFNQFSNLFHDTTVDFDNADGAQCYDLVQFFSRFVGGPRFTGDFAYQIYDQAGDFYTQIPNTPEFVPVAGDIVIWGADFNGGAGHCGVTTGVGDVNTFEVLEQNDPLNSNVQKKTYNYDHVLGFLRVKTPAVSTLQSDLDACLTQHTDLVTKCNEKDIQIGGLNTTITTGETRITELQNQVDTLTTANTAAADKITELETQIGSVPVPTITPENISEHAPTLSALITEIKKLFLHTKTS